MVPNLRTVRALGIALAFLSATTAVAQNLPAIPPPQTESIVQQSNPTNILRGRIEFLHAVRIGFAREGYEREQFNRPEYQVLYCDGLTNAKELIAIAQQRVAVHDQRLALIESQGASPVDEERLIKEIKATSKLLTRIKLEAKAEFQQAKFLAERVSDARVRKAIRQHQVVLELRGDPNFEDLVRQARANRVEAIANVCAKLLERLDSIELQGVDVATLKDVAGRLKQQVGTYATASAHLKDVMEELAAPDGLAAQLNALDRQLEAIEQVQGLTLLGPEILAPLAQLPLKLRERKVVIGKCIELTQPMLSADQQMPQLIQTLNGMSFDQVARQSDKIEHFLDAFAAKLAVQPDSEATRYARAYFDRVGPKIRNQVFDSQVSIGRESVSKLNSQIDAVSDLTRANELIQDLTKNVLPIRQLKQQAGKIKRREHDVDLILFQAESSLTRGKCKKESLELQVIRDRVESQLKLADSRTLVSRLASLTQAGEGVSAISARLEDLGKQPAARSHSEFIETRSRLKTTTDQIAAAISLLAVHQPLSQITDAVDWTDQSRLAEQLQLTAQVVALADEARSRVPNLAWAPFTSLSRHTDQIIADLRARIAEETPRAALAEKRILIDRKSREAASAYDAGELPQGRDAHLAMLNELAKLETLAAKSPAISSDPTYRQAIEIYKRNRDDFANRYERLVVDQRKQSGWFAMPMGQQVLVAPTPDNRVWQIELLIGRGQLDEANERLVAFRKEFTDPRWSKKADELTLKLQFQLGLREEASGNLAAAHDRFQSLVEHDSADGQAFAEAAESAVGRLNHHFRQHESQRSNIRKFSAIGIFVVLGIALVGWFIWRDTESSRLRRSEDEIKRAQAAIASGDGPQRDECLRRAAVLLADFPDNHLQASELRDRLRQPAKTPLPQSDEREFEVAAPELTETIQRMISNSTSLDDVPACLDWLRQADQDHAMRRDAMRWLQRRLSPSETLLPEELNKTAHMIRQAKQLFPGESTLPLYEFAALYWARRDDEARAIAKQIDVTKLLPEGNESLRLALGVCLTESDDWKAAAKVLQPLCTHKSVGNDATKWYRICQISAAASRQSAAAEPVTKLLKKVLSG